MDDETKVCPYCGEEILVIAKKCKHCGEFLNNSNQVSECSIGSLTVDDSWKKRFRLIEQYYIDGLFWKPTEDYKKLSSVEASNIYQDVVFKNGGSGTFISVIVFGSLYYFVKKMWLKGLIYLLALLAIEVIVYLLFNSDVGTSCIVMGWWAFVGVKAPYDYYRYKVLGKQW